MRRMLLMLSIAAVMALAIVLSGAAPAFAQEGGLLSGLLPVGALGN